MSCIAVNIHEVKDKTLRFKLAEPVDGKNGPIQVGKYVNVDTGEAVTSYKLTEVGFYEVKHVYQGANLASTRKTFTGSTGCIKLKSETIQPNDTLLYADMLILVTEAIEIRIQPFEGLRPTSRIDYWYLSIRRVPG